MNRLIITLAAAGALVLVAAGCGGDSSNGKMSGSAAPPPKTGTAGATGATGTGGAAGVSVATRAPKTTTIQVRNTRYGRVLVDANGRALYLFTREKTATGQCYGACATAWPVFYARGNVRAGSGADRHLIGTSTRRDGTRQVTYAGHPLYYYVTDRKPGQITCQNVDEYGGTWLVVAPTGAAIRRG